MSTLEQEIIDKFHQLQPAAKQRVRELIEQETTSETEPATTFDYAAWLAQTDRVRITLRADAAGHVPSASELVNEAREERDADILRSIGLRDSAGDGTG